MELILVLCAVLFLIGSITDLKWRIVPDWLSYAGVATGLSLRSMMSVDQVSWIPLLEGIVGAGLFFGLGSALFYLKQWGGGDAKILMAFGSFAGLQLSFDALLPSFLINLVFLGGFYGLAWFMFLAVKEFSKVTTQVKKVMSTKAVSTMHGSIYIFVVMLLGTGFILNALLPFIVLGGGVILIFYLLIFSKAVEKTCFVVDKKVNELEEGDWVVKDVKVGEKTIIPQDNVGLTKKEIKTLKDLAKKKKIKTVTIKEGIPFVPSFLLSFIVTVLIGNIVTVVMVI